MSRSLKGPRESVAICGTKKSRKRLHEEAVGSDVYQRTLRREHSAPTCSWCPVQQPIPVCMEQEDLCHPRRHDGNSSQSNLDVRTLHKVVVAYAFHCILY